MLGSGADAMNPTLRWFDDLEPPAATPDTRTGRVLADHLAAARLGTPRPAATAPSEPQRPAAVPAARAERAPQEWETLFEPPNRTPPRTGRLSAVRGVWDDHRGAVLASAAALVAVALIGGLTLALTGGSEPRATESVAAQSSTPSPDDTISSTPTNDCPSSTRGPVTTGNDAGDQRSGAGAIKAFNYAYYVTRSARQARLVTLAGAVDSENVLQAIIDNVRPGSHHCLVITSIGEGTYRVRLSVFPPTGGAPIVYPQVIRTESLEGRTWIASITKDEG